MNERNQELERVLDLLCEASALVKNLQLDILSHLLKMAVLEACEQADILGKATCRLSTRDISSMEAISAKARPSDSS